MSILSNTTAIITISTATLVALVVSLIYTPMVRRLALKYGFVDHPDGKRKIHTDAIVVKTIELKQYDINDDVDDVDDGKIYKSCIKEKFPSIKHNNSNRAGVKKSEILMTSS